MLRGLLLLLCVSSAFAADGAALYTQHCTRCHGPEGQGTKKYNKPLEGNLSVAQLADVIQKTMPENDPGSLTYDQAKAISEVIHGKFYSEIARARNKPARIDLARLTVKQYRHAVADVIGSFRPRPDLGSASGLTGDYFNRTFQMDFRGKGIVQRLDPEVHFNYGLESPWPGKLEPQSYSINWQGSLIAPETGEYEFVVRTPHAGRLYLNDLKKPLIDAWVKSGKDTEFRGRIYLVAGRAYPLRLDYSKGKQGKADNAKKDEKDPNQPSFISLNWVRPHGTLEVIAGKHFVPVVNAEQFICGTRFPPDDRSLGWERGSAVSKEWDAATTEAALDAAGYVGVKLNELAGGDTPEKWKAFAVKFAERAFRRPLTNEQKAVLIDRQFAEAKDGIAAVKRVVLLTLKSPFFLYREVAGGKDDFDTASRLSFALWDSLPDDALLKAAAEGKLRTKHEIATQTERMLKDPRAQAKLKEFLLTWLRADDAHDLMKDGQKFPGFDAAVIADLKTSLEMFLDDVLTSPQADYRQLFNANTMFMNERLAKFYGVKGPEKGFTKVPMEHRNGILTHPYLLASFATNAESSPIHRGVFLARGVLGVSLKPPPEAVAPLAPDLHPGLTTRERVTLQTKPVGCMTCHGLINPLGYTLENYDAVGRYREKDHDKPIDASGSYRTEDGKLVSLRGAKELAAFLVSSPEAHDAFTEQLFHHLVQQPVRAYGANTNDELRQRFATSGFNIRKLVVECMLASATKNR